MSDPAPLVLEWATRALQHYELTTPTVTLLGQSENITFRIDEPSRKHFLLRLHRPRTHTLAGPRQQPAVIASELRWLDALAHDTAIPVPQPVANRAGEFVTLIPQAAGEPLPCTLLRWVAGSSFPIDGPVAEAAAASLGRLLAALHRHASAWSIPPGFVRPSYDSAFVEQVARNLQPGVAAGVIEPADHDALQNALATASAAIAALPRTPETWGIIHNDLHPDNCLIAESEVCPIDFSLCGFGAYLFDLATSLGSLAVGLRRPLLAAYDAQRGLPEHAIHLIEAFFIISRLSSYGFALPDGEQHAWLRRRIPQVVETICLPFVRGESFLFLAR